MKKKKFNILILTATLFLSQSMTVFAVTESDVQAVGKETAAGNVFIWFLCAIAFLKISQKIDSFLSSLGINVGHTGPQAAQALTSYLGQTGIPDAPSYSGVEIGGGRIMDTETSIDYPNGTAFGMYNTEQYMAPEGNYETVTTADNATWYKQYAVDTVDRTPYMTGEGKIAYHENIVQKLPDMPKRKDRV